MSNETKKQIAKAAPNRWLVFCILTFSGGIAFKLSSMKDMFYVPMQEFMGLSNTQIGAALSVYGIVQTIGLIAGIYICDIISKKYMIGGSLIGIGVVGFYIVPRLLWLPAGLWRPCHSGRGDLLARSAEGHSPFG